MFQRDCYGFGGSLRTRLLACHETRWHKDTRHSHANRILTLPDKMRLFLLLLPFFYSTVKIIPGALCFATASRDCCSRHSHCTSVHPRQIGKKMNMIRMGINCLVSPAGLRAASLYSVSLWKRAFCACRNKFVCLAVYNNLWEALFIFSDGDGELKRRGVRQKATTGGNILLPPPPDFLYLLNLLAVQEGTLNGIWRIYNYWVQEK